MCVMQRLDLVEIFVTIKDVQTDHCDRNACNQTDYVWMFICSLRWTLTWIEICG